MRLKRWKECVVIVSLLAPAMSVRADDVSGKLGISGIADATWPLAQQSVKEQAKNVGPGFGGMLSYGVAKHWDLGASYEDVDLGNHLRVEPILGNILYRFSPDSKWTPTILGAAGMGRGVDTKVYNHFSAKGGVGLQYFACPDFSLGPQVNYLYVAQRGTAIRHDSELTAGLFASLFFGGHSEPKVAEAPAPTPAPTPVPPAPAPVQVAVTPAQSSVAPAQTQQFSASVSGSDNQAVSWSLNPPLGTVSPTGLYTAPASVAFAETVTVTAASQADPTKTAMAQVSLTPPAAAPKQVSIKLDVLFDSGKDVVKPEFHDDIQKVGDFMKQYPDTHAEIAGFTDNTGSAALNVKLSQSRADSVRLYLIAQFGIDGGRLTAKGYGAQQPIADNKTAAGRAKNRRVVAVLSAMTTGN